MRPVSFGNAPSDPKAFREWIIRGFRQAEIASNDIDPARVADAFTVSNYTETRTLDAGTATAADIANVLATFIGDLKKRGSKRTSD